MLTAIKPKVLGIFFGRKKPVWALTETVRLAKLLSPKLEKFLSNNAMARRVDWKAEDLEDQLMAKQLLL